MKYFFFMSGVIVGIILCYFIINYSKFSYKKYNYVVLQNDYKIENMGHLKRGTILRIDESYPEGFTRYILYLNMSQNEKTEKKKSEHDYEIMPYGLSPVR